MEWPRCRQVCRGQAVAHEHHALSSEAAAHDQPSQSGNIEASQFRRQHADCVQNVQGVEDEHAVKCVRFGVIGAMNCCACRSACSPTTLFGSIHTTRGTTPRMAIRIKVRHGETINQMLRRFKKLCEKEGLTKEVKRRQYYEKPSERARRDARRSFVRSTTPRTPRAPRSGPGGFGGPGGASGGSGGSGGPGRGPGNRDRRPPVGSSR